MRLIWKFTAISRYRLVSFSYVADEFDYLGMEMLTEGFFFFRLAESFALMNLTRSCCIWSMLRARAYYLVKDSVLRMTFGEEVSCLKVRMADFCLWRSVICRSRTV